MNLKSLLAAGLTFAALALPLGAVAQDAAAPGAATDQVLSPSGTAGTPAAATPDQNWLKICDPLEDGKRACIMRQVKPGARVAIAGMKFFPWWTGPLNLLAWLKNRPYNARAADLWRPWDIVESHCQAFEWQSTQSGMGYIGHGTAAARPPDQLRRLP